MSILILRLMIDFGLLILIWITQLMLYPAFLFFSPKELVRWHPVYTKRISFIVMPLMLSQGVIIAYQLISDATTYSISSAIVYLLLLLLTFFVAVPLHQKIEGGFYLEKSCKKLLKTNWKRTIGWTVLWILSFAEIFFYN